MSIRDLITDINSISVTELSGVTANPASAMNVQAKADGTFALAAGSDDSGGGGVPSGGTFIMSSAITLPGYGSTLYETLSLAPGTSAAEYYISGGVEYVSTGTNTTVRQVFLTNPTGIANGQLHINGRGGNASQPDWMTSMVWNNSTNGFVGFPLSGTFHGNASNTFMALGANGSNFNNVYTLSTVLSGSASNINIGIYAGSVIFGSIAVKANQTVTIGIQTDNVNGNRSRMFANKLS